ncbi:MAG: hypothetical protein PHN85_08685 [Kiritimatiellae bacterium]|nr:hypothetical protein [Kiritimatiellia bacterium]
MKNVLFLAALSVSALLADEVKFDNRFLQNGERDIRGWTFNAVEGFKPWGDVTAVMLDGRPGVRLSSKGKHTQIYLSEALPVKSGEKYIVTAKARGNARCSIGFFQYGTQWQWKGSHGKPFIPEADLAGKPVAVRESYRVPDGVLSVRPTLCAHAAGDVEIYDLRIDRVPGQGHPQEGHDE